MIKNIISLGIFASVMLILVTVFLKLFIYVNFRKRVIKSFLDLYNLTWEAANISKFKAQSELEFPLVNAINYIRQAGIFTAILTLALAILSSFF